MITHYSIRINRIRLEFKVHTVIHLKGFFAGINRIRLEFKEQKNSKVA